MRSRNIKPGVFANEYLAECTPWARLCFCGLWMLADREGRMEDRAKRIKGDLFAFDSIEVEPLLAELAGRGFIVRYEAENVRLIQVVNFLKHQNPHVKERPSSLPTMQSTVLCTHGTGPKPGALAGWNSLSSPPNPADSLIPDSQIQVETSQPAAARAQPSAEPHHEPADTKETEDAKAKVLACPHLAILSTWAEVLPEMPEHLPREWRGTRSANLKARWRENAVRDKWADEAQGVEFFRRVFRFVGKSPFLTGKTHTQGKKPFLVELEWLVKQTNWSRVIEGKYHEATP